MQAVIDIVLPVFGLVLAGYLVARTPILDEPGIKGLTNFVFFVAIPALLFRTMSTLTLPDTIDPLVIVAYFGSAAIVYGFGFLVARLVFKLPYDESGLMAMGGAFSNVVLLGLPLTVLTFGEKGLIVILFIVSFHPLVMLALPTVVIELARGKSGRLLPSLLSALGALLRNPIILAMVVGLLWGWFGIGMPKAAGAMIDLLKAAAPPTALFALGASLTRFELRGDLAQSVSMTSIKLLVMPAMVWVACSQVFGLDPLWTGVATLTAAMPVGVNVFLLASVYETYVARAASAIVISTALAVFTTALLIALLAPVP